jgi:plastocyanin
MKGRLIGTLVAFAALAGAPSVGAATVGVNIERDGFRPTSRTITEGDTVRWTNRDTVNHQVVSDSGAFVSPILRPGASFSFTFRASGTYRYRDALEPAERGAIVVRGAPPAVSLGATVPILAYGSETRLQGTISSRRAGETVTILAQPYGQSSYTQIGVAQTGANGVFDHPVRPELLTNYQVQYRTATSQPVTVQVRPRMSLMPYGRTSFVARLSATRSFAGRSIYFQRRSPFGQWVTIAKYRLGQRSGRIFRKPQRTGTYRVFITVNQAGVGYLESWSGTQRIR